MKTFGQPVQALQTMPCPLLVFPLLGFFSTTLVSLLLSKVLTDRWVAERLVPENLVVLLEVFESSLFYPYRLDGFFRFGHPVHFCLDDHTFYLCHLHFDVACRRLYDRFVVYRLPYHSTYPYLVLIDVSHPSLYLSPTGLYARLDPNRDHPTDGMYRLNSFRIGHARLCGVRTVGLVILPWCGPRMKWSDEVYRDCLERD